VNAYGVKAWCGLVNWGGGICLLAAIAGPIMSVIARGIDGRISAAAPLALADQLPLSIDCKTRRERLFIV